MQAGVRGLVLASVAVAMLTAAGGVHVEVFPDGARYEGELLGVEFHGRGVYTWPDGRRYEGEWRGGVRWFSN